MKKILIILFVTFVSIILFSKHNINYQLTNDFIKGYPVILKDQGYCEAYFEVTYDYDDQYRYFTPFSGCQYDDYVYIIKGYKLISLKEAVNEGTIKVSDLKSLKIIKREEIVDEN